MSNHVQFGDRVNVTLHMALMQDDLNDAGSSGICPDSSRTSRVSEVVASQICLVTLFVVGFVDAPARLDIMWRGDDRGQASAWRCKVSVRARCQAATAAMGSRFAWSRSYRDSPSIRRTRHAGLLSGCCITLLMRTTTSNEVLLEVR